MANHSEQNIADAVQVLKTARQQAEMELEGNNQPTRLARSAAA
jgi:hypothetical protein